MATPGIKFHKMFLLEIRLALELILPLHPSAYSVKLDFDCKCTAAELAKGKRANVENICKHVTQKKKKKNLEVS